MFNKVIFNYLYLFLVLFLLMSPACGLKEKENRHETFEGKAVISYSSVNVIVSVNAGKKSCCVKPPSKNKMIVQASSRN